jgi:hypothetical protein
VPADFAAWYFSLHSFDDKAAAGEASIKLADSPPTITTAAYRENIAPSPRTFGPIPGEIVKTALVPD